MQKEQLTREEMIVAELKTDTCLETGNETIEETFLLTCRCIHYRDKNISTSVRSLKCKFKVTCSGLSSYPENKKYHRKLLAVSI